MQTEMFSTLTPGTKPTPQREATFNPTTKQRRSLGIN